MNAFQVYDGLGDDSGWSLPASQAVAVPDPVTEPLSPADPASVVTLRRSGSRPLVFTGRHLGQHNGYRLGTPLWHELNLWQTDEGSYVTDIRVFAKSAGSKDQFHVSVVDGLEAALQVFESYDARADVVAEFDIDDPALAPAELMVQAAALRYRIADAVSQYRAVLGAFLVELSAA